MLLFWSVVWYTKNMEVITSKSNTKVVLAKKLLQKKYRDQQNLFLAETKKVVLEAINAGIEPQAFFVKQNIDCSFLPKKVPIFLLCDAVFAEISSIVSPDGIVAVFKKPTAKKQYLGGNFLVLDHLQNPDNFGAIMRSALACNFKQIFVINSVDEFSPKVIRASMGNQFKLNIVHISISDLQKLFANATLYTASMEGKDIFKIQNFNKNVGVVIGNEGNGVSPQIKNLVKNTISIPMCNGVESLNASVSASIIMYQICIKQL